MLHFLHNIKKSYTCLGLAFSSFAAFLIFLILLLLYLLLLLDLNLLLANYFLQIIPNGTITNFFFSNK